MPKNKKMNKVIALLMVFFLFFLSGITGRFLYIQASGEVDEVSLEQWAKNVRETSMPLYAERGKIFDENGKLLVYNRPTYRMYAILNPDMTIDDSNPKHVIDPNETAKQLAPFLEMDESEIKQIIENGIQANRWQVEFGKNGRNLTRQQMEEIKALRISGIDFMEDSVRYYANGVFASHILGFTRPDEETKELKGVIGIESQFNQMLTGTDGFIKYERDKFNRKLLRSQDVIQKPKNGNDIYLTLDHKIQVLLEDVLSEVDEKFEPENMSVIVMHAKTGQILALSNRPAFNPNEIKDVKNWYNDAISTPVEPGSTAKIFTWAAAIDSGNYNGNELFQSGTYKINPIVEQVNDHNQGKGWGKITYDDGFARSSNVAASKLVWEKIGVDLYYDYLQDFHFDQLTGVLLPNEKSGQILYNWPSEKLRTAFGQGSTVTPIQQMKAATAIVNDGKMLQPYIVKKIVDSETGKAIEEFTPEVVGTPIKAETATQMLDLLEAVVYDEHGTGKKYRLKDYTVIGKTGTAQIPDPNGRGYLTGRENYIFSFLGMAPKEDSQLMIHVSVQQPKLKVTESGSDPVAYIFTKVMENSLRYLNIEPDIEQEASTVLTLKFPNIINKNVNDVKTTFEEMGVTPIIIGDGKRIIDANFVNDELFLTQQKVLLLTDQPKMPDVKGWSKRDVMQLAQLLNIEIELIGNGYAIEQSIKKGKAVNEKVKLTVKFSPE